MKSIIETLGKEHFIEVVKKSESIADIIRNYGLTINGKGNRDTVKNFGELWGVTLPNGKTVKEKEGFTFSCSNCGKLVYRRKSLVERSSTKLFFCNKKCLEESKKQGGNLHQYKFGTLKEKICPECGNIVTLKGRKFCSKDCYSLNMAKRKEEKMFSENGKTTKYYTQELKRHFIAKTGYKCARCGLSEWMGQPIPLHLHHIDGNHNNNKPENLEILCLNCHGLTENYGYKSRKMKN